MKRLIGILLCNLFILTACSASVDKTSNSTKTTDYKIENGETLKVPEKPKRVAVLTGFYVGDYIGENDVERVAKAKPDLIVVDAMDKNIKKYQKIAPTIPYTYNKYNHKEILKEIGKLTNNEDKAKKWIEEWDDKTRKDKKEIQSKIGQATASVFEPDEKQIYIYNSTWGRGLDIVHDAFGMPMTKQYKDKLQEDKKGYASISKENISKYAGDYIFLSKPSYGKFDFEKTHTWQNIEAVKKGHVISYKAEDYWFTDPITLEHLRSKLKKEILNKK